MTGWVEESGQCRCVAAHYSIGLRGPVDAVGFEVGVQSAVDVSRGVRCSLKCDNHGGEAIPYIFLFDRQISTSAYPPLSRLSNALRIWVVFLLIFGHEVVVRTRMRIMRLLRFC